MNTTITTAAEKAERTERAAREYREILNNIAMAKKSIQEIEDSLIILKKHTVTGEKIGDQNKHLQKHILYNHEELFYILSRLNSQLTKTPLKGAEIPLYFQGYERTMLEECARKMEQIQTEIKAKTRAAKESLKTALSQ